MDRLEYTQASLWENEILKAKQKGIRLYDGDTRTSFDGGVLWLTSHRILWGKPNNMSNSQHCFGLNLHYVVLVEEEHAGFVLGRSDKIVLYLNQPLPGKSPGPVERSTFQHIKLSFREGGEGTFFQQLEETLQEKLWQRTSSSHSIPGKTTPFRSGIVGIERQIHERQKETDANISKAFEDLSKLMNMAKDMVSLAKNISRKIKEKQGEITEDETVRFKSYLLSLGIDDPVTREMYGSSDAYHTELAKQLVHILLQPVEESGGMLSLTDAYCMVNRARGLELLSPEDLLHACRLLSQLRLPLRLREFESGVLVLQTHSDQEVIQATMALLDSGSSLTAEELAQTSGISVILAKERLLVCEKAGQACRDDTVEGLRFYPNLILARS